MSVDKSAWELDKGLDEAAKETHEELIPLDQTVSVPMVNLVLERSESENWGLVKDTHHHVNNIPDDAEIVGRWSIMGYGTFWIQLTTPVEVLRDRLMRLTIPIAKEREENFAKLGVGHLPPRKRDPEDYMYHPCSGELMPEPRHIDKPRRQPRQPEPEPGPSETSLKLGSLKDKLNNIRKEA